MSLTYVAVAPQNPRAWQINEKSRLGTLFVCVSGSADCQRACCRVELLQPYSVDFGSAPT
jgi:hypothetical protein